MIPWEDVELRAGDVLQRPFKLSWNIPIVFVGLNIVRAQRRFFGSSANYWTTHSMYYLGGGKVTDCTVPSCRVFNLSDLRGEKIRVLRYMRYDIASNAGLCTYIAGVADSYKGKHYDWLDLLQFLAAEAVNHNPQASAILANIIGLGKDRLICSTYVATLYRKIRTYVHDVNLVDLPKLFGGTPVELTWPANFDNAPADFFWVNQDTPQAQGQIAT